MAIDVPEGGRPRRGFVAVVTCPDPQCSACRSKLVRRVTDRADYVLHVEDAADGDELRGTLIRAATHGGQYLRDVLDELSRLQTRPKNDHGTPKGDIND